MKALAAIVSVLFLACGSSSASSSDSCPRVLPSCPTPAPSYGNVAPIFSANCITCHNPDSLVARGDFTTYAGIELESGSVLNEVYGCNMPPAGSPSLSSDDRELLLQWFECGSPGP